MEEKTKMTAKYFPMAAVPVVDCNVSPEDAFNLFQKHQILLIKDCARGKAWNGINCVAKLHSKYQDIMKETWTVENFGTADEKKLACSSFFSTQRPVGAWYVSTILQKDDQLVDNFLNQMPLMQPAIFESSLWSHLKHSKPIWLFMGHNSSQPEGICGRKEHTDSVSHSGTWHLQLSGTKTWKIRPLDDSAAWGGNVPYIQRKIRPLRDLSCSYSRVITDDDGVKRFEIECNEGDVIIVNTKLWWHQTTLPISSQAKDSMSISFARDFFLESRKRKYLNTEDETASNDIQMTNIDGFYAPKFIRQGDIVLTEDEMPDCSLPRSVDPNCEVVWLESGEGALVAVKDIQAGEWFSIAPSDDEDEDDDDDAEYIEESYEETFENEE